jgi:DNA-binding CsgD family transcriptional regulator
VVLVNLSGAKVFANRQARDAFVANDGLTLGRGSSLRAAMAEEQAGLDRLIGRAALAGAGRGSGAGGVMLVSRPSGARSYQVLVAPVGSLLRWHQPDAVAIVLFGDPDRTPPVASEVLARLYGLTAAEAAVAVAIARGEELSDIAAARGVSLNTVRTHLYRALTKTDTRRQTDLVRLLLRGPLAALATPMSPAPRA